MTLICVSAYSHVKPGDEVEIPDGAEYSSLYLAESGSIAAQRAVADRKAADAAAAAQPSAGAARSAASKTPLTPPSTPPPPGDGKEGT